MKSLFIIAAIFLIHQSDAYNTRLFRVRLYDIECPEEPTGENIYFPVPGDCTSYYECSNGVPIKMPCPPGLEWGPEIERCDLPEVANCPKDSTSEGPTTEKQTTEEQTTIEGSTMPPGVECPAENPEDHDIFFPVPGDCTSYYECDNGVPIKMKCPPGQEWGQEIERCDWPEVAQCSTGTTSSDLTSGAPTEKPPVDCPAENPEGHDIFFPVPGDCTSYYECDNGVPVKMSCPPGQEWGQEIERCDWPEVAQCSTKTRTM